MIKVNIEILLEMRFARASTPSPHLAIFHSDDVDGSTVKSRSSTPHLPTLNEETNAERNLGTDCSRPGFKASEYGNKQVFDVSPRLKRGQLLKSALARRNLKVPLPEVSCEKAGIDNNLRRTTSFPVPVAKKLPQKELRVLSSSSGSRSLPRIVEGSVATKRSAFPLKNDTAQNLALKQHIEESEKEYDIGISKAIIVQRWLNSQERTECS